MNFEKYVEPTQEDLPEIRSVVEKLNEQDSGCRWTLDFRRGQLHTRLLSDSRLAVMVLKENKKSPPLFGFVADGAPLAATSVDGLVKLIDTVRKDAWAQIHKLDDILLSKGFVAIKPQHRVASTREVCALYRPAVGDGHLYSDIFVSFGAEMAVSRWDADAGGYSVRMPSAIGAVIRIVKLAEDNRDSVLVEIEKLKEKLELVTCITSRLSSEQLQQYGQGGK